MTRALPTSSDETLELLTQSSYVADRSLATVLFLALKMQRPLFLEGEAGVGKTEIAKVLSSALDRPLIRLQCYEGLDINAAAYEWNVARQLVEIRLILDLATARRQLQQAPPLPPRLALLIRLPAPPPLLSRPPLPLLPPMAPCRRRNVAASATLRSRSAMASGNRRSRRRRNRGLDLGVARLQADQQLLDGTSRRILHGRRAGEQQEQAQGGGRGEATAA